MTQSALNFVGEATFQAITGERVASDLYGSDQSGGMQHIDLARWADFFIVAPATANLIAKHAQGIADDLLTNLLLAYEGQAIVAPAMNQAMWNHMATQSNVSILKKRLTQIAGPALGDLACGETGLGRMLEPEALLQCLRPETQPLLKGKTVVITAGPTHEAIDPVRFIANKSSGKMGYALAQAAADAGADVVLISGPSQVTPPENVNIHRVTTAEEMMRAVESQLYQTDIFIGAAAVADYRVEQIASDKIKKNDTIWSLNLVQNPDILGRVANSDQVPYCVGFAAETNDVEVNGRKKLIKKDLDLLIANPVNLPGVGFDSDENQAIAIFHNHSLAFEKQSKYQLASQIIKLIADGWNKKHNED